MENLNKTYQDGYLQALYDYAWWKDGIMYVGCGRKTYKQAKEEFIKKNMELVK